VAIYSGVIIDGGVPMEEAPQPGNALGQEGVVVEPQVAEPLLQLLQGHIAHFVLVELQGHPARGARLDLIYDLLSYRVELFGTLSASSNKDYYDEPYFFLICHFL
jgi:hypothetical protein